MFTYEIEGKTYTQNKLVLGQVAQLSALLAELRFAAVDPLSLVAGLGERLTEALAIVLVPKGIHPADKDLQAMRRDLFMTDVDTVALQVIEDFFTCNPLPLLLEKVTGLINKTKQQIG